MDSLLCLVLGSALTVIALAVALRRGFQQISVTAAYREVSRQLALSVDTRGTSIQGHLGERRLWIGQVMTGHGTDRRRAYWGILDLERPLGLGLTLRRRGMSDRLFRRSREPELPIGDSVLDRSFEVSAVHPDQVKLLFTGRVREALTTLTQEWRDVVITDRAVRVYLSSPESSARRLMRLVNALNELAMALDESRTQGHAPAPLEPLVQDWQPLADDLGLELLDPYPALDGELDGHRLTVFPELKGDRYQGELRLFFKPHRSVGLRIFPQVMPDGYWSVGQDIQVGAPAFDEAFVIKGFDSHRVRELLQEPLRDELLALHKRAPIELDDRMLIVRQIDLDAETVADLIGRVVAVADHLDW